ncbi:MAG: 50S ribosomal protein L11 methyltransferase [Bryobacteraceae bacterium]|nr:50S ribosomal protein L11 methyltransferase [Bryobacteraceae bacterium]
MSTGFSLTLSISTDGRDELIADLWEARTTGITEDTDWVRAFFDEGADKDLLLRQFDNYAPHLEIEEDYDWVAHSQSMWQPIAVGQRFWLTPDWRDDPVPEGRIRLQMRPGMACGSGEHPASQLCLQALERVVRSGSSVLDVGTGSGILADAALLLGAGFVIGCDEDDEATVIARQNVPEACFFTGSVQSVKDRSVDVVVANLNAATVQMLGSDLGRIAKTALIVSGFPEDDEPELPRPVRERLTLNGWICLIC